jgi:isoquinoline 1-oxidoreductase alpha subunit
MSIALNVNGKTYNVSVPGDMPLLWVLRDIIGLTGTKYGCGIEICGACTVHIDGQAEKSCDMDVQEAAGRKIVTIEGLSANNSHPIQKAWISEQVPQCGYCQSGMIMSAAAVLKEHPQMSDSDVNEVHNICVCGTYPRVRAAMKVAAKGGV